jgi:hypothetical protein
MAKNWNQQLVFILMISIYVIARYMYLSHRHKRLYKVETFTPKINAMYRPYVREINNKYESFMNNYGPDVIINKLKKWDIY